MTNGRKILEAMGNIKDSYIEDAIQAENVKKKKKRIKGLWAAVIFLIVLGTAFTSVFTVSAQFRQWVIQLFYVPEVEEVPAKGEKEKTDGSKQKNKKTADKKEKQNEDAITLYAVNNIEDIFHVQYLVSDQYMSSYGEGLYYTSENGSNSFYKIENDTFVPLDSNVIQRKVTIDSISGTIDYTYCEYNNHIYLLENNREKVQANGETEAIFTLESFDTEHTFLTLYKNPQGDSYSYPVLYDIETGLMTDIFDGITMEGKRLKEYEILHNWEYVNAHTYTVSIGNTKAEEKAYIIDINKKTVFSMEELTGIRNISSVKIVEGKIMLYERMESEIFNYYCYDYKTDELIKIYENAIYWNELETADTDYRVKFSGGRYDFVQKNGRIFLVDEIRGNQITIEGITGELAESVLINYSGDKLLVSEWGDAQIIRLGVIDLTKKCFYLLNRSNHDKHESAVYWNDDKHIAIEATDEDWQQYYLYLYSIAQ